MSKRMARLRIAGQGSYGIVYLATDANNVKGDKNRRDTRIENIPEDKLFAIKRNFKEKPTFGYGNLREANMMTILSGHPYIVNLLGIKHNDPFEGTREPMTPIGQTDFAKLLEDRMLFVMEYLPYNGEEYLKKKTRTPFSVKVLAMQLMLAIEYAHSQGVVHRDVRTSNVLISEDEEGNVELKLCDFGLSRIMCDGRSTPGTITSWYRAPEVCCSSEYNRKVDIWSAGCVIYELVSGVPLLKDVKDDDTEIFNAILSKLPEQPSRTTINKLFESGKKLNFQQRSSQINRPTFVERMNLSGRFRKEFESVPGSLEQLEDLLQSMLCLDPAQRISASRALDHPFFDWTRSHISKIRRDFPPEPPPLPFYPIYPCKERSWIASLCFKLNNSAYNRYPEKRLSLKSAGLEDIDDIYISKTVKEWYCTRVIFHAIDLFDQYIDYKINEDESTLRDRETEHLGRIHSKEETYLNFYCCLYIMHKYYSTLEMPLDWKSFVPDIFTDERSKRKATDFEELVVDVILKNELFRKTLLEISSEFLPRFSETKARDLLVKLFSVNKPWLNKSVRALYRMLNDIPSPVLTGKVT
jgi:serine/threonine protein kinase